MSDKQTTDEETGLNKAATTFNSKKALMYAGVALLVLVGLWSVSKANASTPDDRIKEAFPKTTFDRIYADESTKLIVAESGNTVLYFTPDGRYALVGNILDLERKVDMTEERKRSLAAANQLEAKAFGKALPAPAAQAAAAGQAAPAPQGRPAAPTVMEVDLPDANFVVHNAGASRVIYVVSDYNCSFCKRLNAELDGLDVEVREIPVSYLGQESGIKAASALCSDDPGAKAQDFYNGTAGTSISTCTEGENIVAQNTQWAQSRGISGTPFIIDEDGKTNNGFMPQGRLKAFLGLGS